MPGTACMRLTSCNLHGSQPAAEELPQASQANLGCFNIAYIERLNATFRTWLPFATRKTRTPAARCRHLEAAFFSTVVIYNFCHIHITLQAAPDMAAGIVDSVWSIDQLCLIGSVLAKSTPFCGSAKKYSRVLK